MLIRNKEEKGISQSAMILYMNCPYAWFLKYMKDKEPMFWDPSVLNVGSIVHSVLDSYYKMHFISEGTDNDILIEVYNILKKKWDTTLLPEQFKKAYICLENFSKWEYKNLLSGLRIHTKPLTEIKADENGFFGILDYVDVDHGDVIDWKTNTFPTLSRDYKFQAAIYTILYEKKFDRKLREFKFYYLYPDIIRHLQCDSSEMREFIKEAETIKNSILKSKEDNNFPKQPKTEKGCRDCLYKYYCMLSEIDDISTVEIN